MMDTKIFVIYFKPDHLFRSAIFQPIQAGAENNRFGGDVLYDDCGDNISSLNPFYGELTAWYWVLKNYLPAHPEIKHVGFCHYRRFLDFTAPPNGAMPFRNVLKSDFINRFPINTDQEIAALAHSWDIILPAELDLRRLLYCAKTVTVYSHYRHPKVDLDLLIKHLKDKHDIYSDFVDGFFSDNRMYSCLHFLMKVDLFKDLATWLFSTLNSLSLQSSWGDYEKYGEIRTPAFLAERMINIWIRARIANATILERDSVLLCDQMPSLCSRLKEFARYKIHPERLRR